MKRLLLHILCLLAILSPLPAHAGKAKIDTVSHKSPIIELQPGKKLLKVADLDMPDDITLGELLNMFPELLARNDEEKLTTFDLQIDDISAGTSKETLLEQLRVSDLKEIELSVNPSTSSQSTGQGGVINIILNDPDKGFNGDVMLTATTEWYVTPAVKMNYDTDKLQMRWMVSGEYYNPVGYGSQSSTYYPDGKRMYNVSADDYKYGYEFANFNLIYTPDARNKLKVWAWESYSNENHREQCEKDESGLISNMENDNCTQEVSLAVGGNYKYSFDRGFFETELSYQYDPRSNSKNVYSGTVNTESFYDNNSPQTLAWYAKGRYQLIPTTETEKCELTCGLNIRYEPKLYSFTDSLTANEEGSLESISASCNSLYISPYAEVNAMFGPCFAKGGLRYQFYQYSITMNGGDNFSLPQNNLTAFLNFGWCIAPHHNLSVIADKSLKRPDNEQVYPGKFYDPSRGQFITGNDKLIAENIYTASVDYQYDFTGNGHTVLAGCGLRYNRITDAIMATTSPGTLPSFTNDGYGDILMFNAMAVYSHGPFKVFFTGNLQQNWTHLSEIDDQYFSYNLCLKPMLFFPTGDWKISGQFEYNSNVRTINENLGHYFYSEVRLSKGFKRWAVYIKLSDNFHKVVNDYAYSSDGSITLNQHYLHTPAFGLGGSFKF